MAALYRRLRQQPMTDGIALAIIGTAALSVFLVAVYLGLPE